MIEPNSSFKPALLKDVYQTFQPFNEIKLYLNLGKDNKSLNNKI